MTESQDTYNEIRDDLEQFMAHLDSASGLACFLVMEGIDHGATTKVVNEDFINSMHSLHNLLEYIKRDGNELVERMMKLEVRP